MTRKDAFVEDECYHIFLRGNMKQDIFFDDSDRWRFLTLMFLMQPIVEINTDMSTIAKIFRAHFSSAVRGETCNEFDDLLESAVSLRKLDVLCFVLMPNHFHLILRCLKDDSISRYMQRILNSYTKYINKKYDRIGHLFQGAFGSKLITDNDQLLYLTTYIHRNIRKYLEWTEREVDYPWSSFQDYTKKNRWGKLLNTKFVLGQFSNKKEFFEFTNDSIAKDAEYS